MSRSEIFARIESATSALKSKAAYPDYDLSLVRTIPDAIAAFGDSPNIIWCTGPSKTADVEGILIEGVHGPGEQIALLV